MSRFLDLRGRPPLCPLIRAARAFASLRIWPMSRGAHSRRFKASVTRPVRGASKLDEDEAEAGVVGHGGRARFNSIRFACLTDGLLVLPFELGVERGLSLSHGAASIPRESVAGVRALHMHVWRLVLARGRVAVDPKGAFIVHLDHARSLKPSARFHNRRVEPPQGSRAADSGNVHNVEAVSGVSRRQRGLVHASGLSCSMRRTGAGGCCGSEAHRKGVAGTPARRLFGRGRSLPPLRVERGRTRSFGCGGRARPLTR